MTAPLRVESSHTETAIVRRYLKTIDNSRTKPRLADPAARLRDIEMLLSDKDTDPIPRLDLLQERIELRRLATQAAEAEAVTAEFVQVALDYSIRKGICYGAWRDYGVPAAILKEAGIKP